MTDQPEITSVETSAEKNTAQLPLTDHGNSSFLDDLINTTAETPKQTYDVPITDTPPSQDENNQANSANNSQADPKMSADRIRAEANVHVRMFDFAASRGLSMYSGDNPERFKSTEDEKKELVDALAEWYATMDSVPKLPPWIFVMMTAILIYGPKISDARKFKKEKKAEETRKKKEASDRFAKPIPFTVVSEKPEANTAPVSSESK